jgi:MarR-like DNA-binding transcriptional regulator SgrR of sgrS sRNA
LQRKGFLKSVIAAPLAPGALAASSSAPRTVAGSDEAGGGCWSFAIDPHARFPNGSRVRPADLVTAWETGLREPASAHHWLLSTVEGSEALDATRANGVSGLRAMDDRLEICVSTATPDLPERLSHPALWLWRRSESNGMWEGPGPFRQIAATRLEANPAAGMPPLLDAVQLVVDPSTDPALLINLAEADLGVVFGRAAERLRQDARENLSLTRLPHWDRVYFLWVDRGARWVNDPRFRRWLSGVIDRQSMVDYLFAGQGEPVQTLSGAAVANQELQSKPLERLSRPRLSLVYDENDPLAARIAGRLVAAVRLEAIELSLIARGADELRSAAGDPAPSMVLSVHQPWSDDPVLGLIGLLPAPTRTRSSNSSGRRVSSTRPTGSRPQDGSSVGSSTEAS